MEIPVYLIAIPGSEFAGEIAACLGGGAFVPRILSIDAPMEGKRVTFSPGSIVWEGAELFDAAAIFAECSLFNWPQALLPIENDSKELQRREWVIFQREARSLIVSSIWAAGRERPMINPPAAAHFSISVPIALDHLERSGIAVHPWSVESASARVAHGGKLVLDVCGRDRWHSPRRPETGDPALVLEPHRSEVVRFMIVGGVVIGAVREESGESWARRQIGADVSPQPDPLRDIEPYAEAVDLAKRSMEALGLVFAAVSVRTGASTPAVMLVEASPDLAAWNSMLDGRVARAIADCLAATASSGASQQRSGIR